MKTRLKKNTVLSVILTIIMLSQSCRVYDAGSITVEQAVASKSFVKIRKHNGSPAKYKQVIEEDGTFYGIIFKRGEMIKQEIDLTNIRKIKRKNRTWSTVATIVGGVSLVYVVVVSIALASFTLGSGNWNWSW